MLADQCLLFEDGRQDVASAALKITELKSVLLKCSNGVDERIATRSLKIAKQSSTYYLLVDPQSLKTEIQRQGCFRCEPIELSALANTRFGAAVTKEWPAPPKNKPKAPPLAPAAPPQVDLVNAGFHRGGGTGSFLTADLCPSHLPLERAFFEALEKQQVNAPVALSVSGRWLEKHLEDFQWLKNQVANGNLDVTWINHSYYHKYDEDEDDDVNFMRLPGTNFKIEILRTERVMIENGVTPSVFFRFPGLISDQKLMHRLQSYSLIPIGKDAWLAELEIPHDGSIMLVHGNGNEPAGLVRYQKLLSRKQIPLPLQPLSKVP